jgi:tetratricopeptide (TPR) repeat protein
MSEFKYDEQFFEADQLINDGHIVRATEMLEAIINEQPDYGRAHNHLGWVYERHYRDYIRAEQHYRAALAYEPNYVPIYLNYAALLSTMTKFKDLETLLDRAITIAGMNRPAVYNEYGILHELQGKFDPAIENYRKAIAESINTKDVDIYEDSVRRCERKRMIFATGISKVFSFFNPK